MTAITEGLGTGAIKDLTLEDVFKEPWCEFMTADVKL